MKKGGPNKLPSAVHTAQSAVITSFGVYRVPISGPVILQANQFPAAVQNKSRRAASALPNPSRKWRIWPGVAATFRVAPSDQIQTLCTVVGVPDIIPRARGGL